MGRSITEVHPGASTISPTPIVQIRPLQPGEDSAAFRSLNEDWIRHYFVLEEKDHAILGDPEGSILHVGGHILMAYLGDRAIGCVALIPMENNVYELSKMAVLPTLRGLGIGRRILEAAIAHAISIGASSLFLGSSTKLPNAVHLYESVGFRHVPPTEIPPMPYTRANVFMKLPL